MDQRRYADVATRLHALAIHLLRRVRVEDPTVGLTPARLSALSVVVFGGPRTIGELAAAEQVTGPTMTRLVSGLEADGYLKRAPSPIDGRSVIVRATAKAERALERARRRRVEHLMAALGPLGEREWAVIAKAVALLERALRASGW